MAGDSRGPLGEGVEVYQAQVTLRDMGWQWDLLTGVKGSGRQVCIAELRSCASKCRDWT